jgi:hypothetical protein
MLYAHANTLTDARSYLAALADQASSAEASSAYEHALLELDWIHGDDVPALDTVGLTSDRDRLSAAATAAIEKLADYGVDQLRIELVLAALDDARTLDVP